MSAEEYESQCSCGSDSCDCEGNCGGCSEQDCPGHQEIPKLQQHPGTNIKKIIAVMSGKGGVGKSLVTSLLAKELMENGHRVAILDADVTGPSIPKTFGVVDKAVGTDDGIYACTSKHGIPLMSVNCLLENDTDPIVWRGPMISNLVGQLYSDVIYGEAEYLLIDMPPGTGDVPLTIFQELPIDAAVVVTSPQDLVSLIVTKSVKMCSMMNIPLLGVVTNMAYVKCPNCDEKIYLYGQPKTDVIAKSNGIRALDEIAIDPELAKLVDEGSIEEYDNSLLSKTVNAAEKLLD